MATTILAALTLAVALRAAEPRPTVESIGERVMCLCGCVAVLNHCPHQNCSMHAEMRATIQKAVAEGKDEKAILQELTQRYGLKVLAAPPSRGFNLAAWVLPGLGLFVGLAFVVAIVRRWRRSEVGPVRAPSAPIDPKLLAAVEEEIKTSGLGTGG